MRRFVALGIVASVLACGFLQPAEAGVGEAVKNVVRYAFSPVNAVAGALKDTYLCGTAIVGRFVATVAGNVSRNPISLKPLFS